MSYKGNRIYKGDTKYFNERSKMMVKCSCGCSSYIPSYKNKQICRWCGRTIYKHKKDEFIYKLNVQLNKIKK